MYCQDCHQEKPDVRKLDGRTKPIKIFYSAGLLEHLIFDFRARSQISFSMADLISGDKINQIMDAFNSLADRNGIVLTRRLGDLMKALGENPTKEEVQGNLLNYFLHGN